MASNLQKKSPLSKRVILTGLFVSILYLPVTAHTEDKIKLQTTTIKGNKELPKILYVVPWKDIKSTRKAERKLILHSLFGDLFDPVLPEHKDRSLMN